MGTRRFLGVAAAIALLAGAVPTAAFAEETPDMEQVSAVDQVAAVEQTPAVAPADPPPAPADPAAEPERSAEAPTGESPENPEPVDGPPADAAPSAAAPSTAAPSTDEVREGVPTAAPRTASLGDSASTFASASAFAFAPMAGGVDHAVIYENGPGSPVIGTATVSPADWLAGDIVTITVNLSRAKQTYPVDEPYWNGERWISEYSYGAYEISVQTTEFAEPWSTNGGSAYASSWLWRASSSIEDGEKLPIGNYVFQGVAKLDRSAQGGSWGGPYGGIKVTVPLSESQPTTPRYLGGGFRWGAALNDPVANFEHAPDNAEPKLVIFTNTSSDVEDDPSAMTASWDFGDGTSSAEWSPTHRYEQPGSYTVTLTVTDSSGRSDVVQKEVRVVAGLVVNSTGDLPASDPVQGCDTGGTVTGGAPECTLRAAIQAANAAGGGEISFDIEGSPAIPLGSALPAITTPTTIDGTTQAGGWVEVSGGGNAVIALGDGTATLTGLALHGAARAVTVSGGTGHVVEGNRLGVNLAESATGDTPVGVLLEGGDIAAVRNNTISAAQVGVMGVAEGGIIGEVGGNSIGATGAGAPLGDVEIGVLLVGSGPSMIGNNLVRSTKFGVMVASAQAAGTSVTGNRVGTTGASPFADQGTGIVIEAAANVTVEGNTVVAGDWGGILVAGSVQATVAGSQIEFHSPTGPVLEGPATASGATITGNTVTATESVSVGIGSWADAAGLAISGNTVTAAGAGGVSLNGGAGHAIADNVLGAAGAPLRGGVRLIDTDAPTVTGNTVFAEGQGVYVHGDGAGATISGNGVTGDAAGNSTGILVDDERTGVAITGNTVADAGRAGIQVDAPGAQLTENTIANGGVGIVADGAGLTIRDNRIGATAGLAAFPGNRGTGILLDTGDAVIRDNVVVGSGGDGIRIGPDATGTLRANRIWDTAGLPIAAPDAAPQLAAALISDTASATRTTLLVTGIPGAAAGTIEVFANDSCEADGGEAKVVTGITRQTKPGRTEQIIQFESSRDHFTLTYTAADGATSRLSSCEDRDAYPDGDGDGSPDPLDALMGAESDPTVGVIATTNEQLLVAAVADRDDAAGIGGGWLEQLRAVDDPAPGSHPSGWALPYGTLSFRVAGLEPGATARVMLTTFFADEPLQGDAYWKYGAASPGAAAGWYDFAPDAATGTGAERSSADVPGLGYRVIHLLTLIDGARGDEDGAMNGSITDPGGPVVFAGSDAPVVTPSGPATPPRAAAPGLSATGADGDAGQALLWAAAGAILLGALLLRRRGARRPGERHRPAAG